MALEWGGSGQLMALEWGGSGQLMALQWAGIKELKWLFSRVETDQISVLLFLFLHRFYRIISPLSLKPGNRPVAGGVDVRRQPAKKR